MRHPAQVESVPGPRTVGGCSLPSFIIFLIFIRFLERQSVSGERQREGETQNAKQAPGSQLSAQSPTQGSKSWEPQDHDLSPSRTLDRLSHQGAPRLLPSIKTEVLLLWKDSEKFWRFPRCSGLPTASPCQDAGAHPVPSGPCLPRERPPEALRAVSSAALSPCHPVLILWETGPP